MLCASVNEVCSVQLGPTSSEDIETSLPHGLAVRKWASIGLQPTGCSTMLFDEDSHNLLVARRGKIASATIARITRQKDNGEPDGDGNMDDEDENGDGNIDDEKNGTGDDIEKENCATEGLGNHSTNSGANEDRDIDVKEDKALVGDGNGDGDGGADWIPLAEITGYTSERHLSRSSLYCAVSFCEVFCADEEKCAPMQWHYPLPSPSRT